MIDILKGMCERCLVKGLLSTIEDAKVLCDTFDRFRNKKYEDDAEYSRYILYFYNLAVMLHERGYTSLEESYSLYNAILTADRVDFVETNVDNESVKLEPVKNKRNKNEKYNDGVVNIADITM